MSWRLRRGGAWLAGAVGAGLVFAAVARGLLAVAEAPAGLTTLAAEHVPESGVTHPVTAVLLNFRAYDTWLEMVVLLAAVVGVVALRGTEALDEPAEPAGPVVRGLAQTLVPVIVVIGFFVLSMGVHSPGGAFQGGAVLAAGLVFLRLGGYRAVAAVSPRTLWAALVAGVAVFLATAVAALAAGEPLLHIPTWRAYATIVAVEGAVALSVATTLAFMFVAAAPER